MTTFTTPSQLFQFYENVEYDIRVNKKREIFNKNEKIAGYKKQWKLKKRKNVARFVIANILNHVVAHTGDVSIHKQ